MAYELRSRAKASVDKASKVSTDNQPKTQEDGTKDMTDVLVPGVFQLRHLLAIIIMFRWLNSFLMQTFYVPDEYWQSVEVSHRMVFGYGYLTWEWRKGIRGYTYPAMFAAVHKLLALVKLDFGPVLIVTPRVLQATLSAIGDLFVYRFTRRLVGVHGAAWALLCQICSWFVFYIATRTLSNTMENILTTIALYYYPWPAEMLAKGQAKIIPHGTKLYLLFASLACIVRPTAGIVWLPLALWHLIRTNQKVMTVLKDYIPIGLLAIVWSVGIDRIFYGKWIFVPYNFLHFNVLHDIGAFYGSHPFYWYITQGVPVVLASHMLPFFLGVKVSWRRLKPLLFVMAWIVLVYRLGEACSHIAAIVSAVTRAVYLRKKSGTDACTSQLCIWLPPSKNCTPAKVKDINFTSPSAKRRKEESPATVKRRRCLQPEAPPVPPPTDDEMATFYASLNQCQTKPGILRVLDNYSHQFVPIYESPKHPKPLSSLYDSAQLKAGYLDLQRQCETTFDTIKVTLDEVRAVEKDTRNQASSKLWHYQRTGRVTASNFKAAARTNPAMPSQSLIKRICHPEDFKFSTEATSFISHKEFRFILPIMPFAICICGSFFQLVHGTSRATWTVAFLVVTNLPVALYFGMVHQRGTLDMMMHLQMSHLRHESKAPAILFLMPCHSTPYYSHIHQNISMRFLKCDPNLRNRLDFEEEAEVFYDNPGKWLQKEYGHKMKQPDYLVFYDTLESKIGGFLKRNTYEKVASFFHTHFPTDQRMGKFIHIYIKVTMPDLTGPEQGLHNGRLRGM